MCTIWAPEQAIREIYLKPFEIAIKEGRATGVMSSYSYIGPNWSGGSDSLLNKVLRDEWGFRGMVITDYFLGLNFMLADICICPLKNRPKVHRKPGHFLSIVTELFRVVSWC